MNIETEFIKLYFQKEFGDKKILDRLIKDLDIDSKEKLVLSARYVERKQFDVIASDMKISERQVYKLHKNALYKAVKSLKQAYKGLYASRNKA